MVGGRFPGSIAVGPLNVELERDNGHIRMFTDGPGFQSCQGSG